ncbi:hypothetical protein PUN28_004675 [Cardiocondyla obscurior]|uniref:Uncharacterized protein n=1 Tax=Cardiocondyla obscurior TaxID=286306 RepID=A0AAW2GGU1_9HYME
MPLGQSWIYIEDTISREKEQSNVRYLALHLFSLQRDFTLYRSGQSRASDQISLACALLHLNSTVTKLKQICTALFREEINILLKIKLKKKKKQRVISFEKVRSYFILVNFSTFVMCVFNKQGDNKLLIADIRLIY